VVIKQNLGGIMKAAINPTYILVVRLNVAFPYLKEQLSPFGRICDIKSTHMDSLLE